LVSPSPTGCGIRGESVMTKIVLYWWVMTATGGITEPIEIDGWKTMEECEIAAESFTISNPKIKNEIHYAVIAICKKVMK